MLVLMKLAGVSSLTQQSVFLLDLAGVPILSYSYLLGTHIDFQNNTYSGNN